MAVPRPPLGPPPGFGGPRGPMMGGPMGPGQGGLPLPLQLPGKPPAFGAPGGLAPRPPSGPPPAGLVSPFGAPGGAPRPMGGMPMMPRPPMGRPMMPMMPGGPPGTTNVVALPPLSPATGITIMSGGPGTTVIQLPPGVMQGTPVALPGAIPNTPGMPMMSPGGPGGGQQGQGGTMLVRGAGGGPQQLNAGVEQFLSTAKGQKDKSAPPQAKLPPPFGYLHVVIAGCKGLTRAISDVSAKSFVRVTLGDQIKVTGQAKEGGPRPRFGDEVLFDVRNDREIAIELVIRQADGAAAGETVLASARSSIMTWISRGKFSGDIELRDPALQPCGSVSISADYELSPASVAAAAMVKTGNNNVAAAAAIAQQQQQQEAARQGVNTPGGGPKASQTVTVRDPNTVFTDQEIKEAFQSFDLDNNNFVGAAELRHILTHIGEVVTDEEVDEMIRMVDRDGDGQVSFGEFYRMLTNGREPPPGLMQSGPTPGAGGGAGGPLSSPSMKIAGHEIDDTPLDMASVLQLRNQKKAAVETFAKTNGITMEQVKSAWQTFKVGDKLGDGIIEYSAFCELLDVETNAENEGMFGLFDPSRKGYIRLPEFLLGMVNFINTSRDERMRFCFNVFDANKDGAINKDELVGILMGNLLAAGPKEVLKKAETMMEQADTNKDGFIDYEDFVRVATRFPRITFPYGVSGPAGSSSPTKR